MSGQGRSQQTGTSGTEAEADVKFQVINSTEKTTAVTDPDNLLLAKMVGEDSNGNIQRISTDGQGRLEWASSPEINIGDVQLLDSSDAVINPATEGTLMDINSALSNTSGVISGSATDDTTGTSLPSNSVPDGHKVTVKAQVGNSSPVLVDGNFELEPKATVSLQVTDTSAISFTSQSSGDGVTWIVESA